MSDPTATIDAEYGSDFTGNQKINFTEFEMRDKPYGFWLCLKFANDSGDRASVSHNIFTSDITEGRKTGNQITMRGLGELFRAFGLSDADMPDKTPAAIKLALEAYAGNVAVMGTIGKDDNGYNTITKFTKAN